MANQTRSNNSNDAAKRTANQVKAILKSNDIAFSDVENLGDGRNFNIYADGNLRNHVAIKKAGFLIKSRNQNFFHIACF